MSRRGFTLAPILLAALCAGAGPAIAMSASATGSTGESFPFVSAVQWQSMPGARAAAGHIVTHLTVHHQGVFWRPGADVPAYLRRLQQWSRQAKGWADLPYHYIVGPDGTVYGGRDPGVPGDTNTDYDTRGHLQVMLLGNFEEQSVTVPQWDSTVRLLARLMKAHALPVDRLAAHRHHTDRTVCPGATLMARFEELRQAVAQTLHLR